MNRENRERGGVNIYVLLLALTLFAFLVMAADVGRLYLVQGELQTAADAAALAAATRLVGTANAHLHASDQLTATFDSTTGNDNRFNLHTAAIGVSGSELLTEIVTDFFPTLLDAQTNSNGGATGAEARYARVEVRAETPVLFTRFLSLDRPARETVAAAAVAGISAPICNACGIEDLAVAALDPADEENYGFSPGEYYTFYLTPSQQQPNISPCLGQVPAPMVDTAGVAEYVILNHLPSGPEAALDGQLFELGATGISNAPGLDPPGVISIEATEAPWPDLQGTSCAAEDIVLAGRDLVCGLNTRFGVDPTDTACELIEGATDLQPLFPADTDVGPAEALQDFSTEYDTDTRGNFRRVITVPVVDASDTLTVLNFRQFLLQNAPTGAGLNPGAATGAFRVQYIGRPVPLRCGGVGGACTVMFGVGRVVLH